MGVKYLFRILLLLLVLSQTICEIMIMDAFRELCPHNKFCKEHILTDAKPNSTSCCMDCFCDESCHAFGDCCPDAEPIHHDVTNDVMNNITTTNLTEALCVSNIVPTGYKDDIWIFDTSSYRMISTCPSNFIDTGDIVEQCEEKVYDPDRRLDDIVIVSGPNSVVFRNNFCALCHGVTDTVRWELEILKCRIERVRLGASKIKPYMLQNCILASIRPDNQRVNSRLMPCQGFKSECNDDASDESPGCKNGPIMPYFYDYTIYKNALCYRCDGHGAGMPPFCSDTLDVPSRAFMGSLIKLLDIDHDILTSSRQTPTNPCSESKIMDPYMNECRTLYCPPFEAASYGKCQPIASPAHMTVVIRFVFWTTDNIIVSRPVNMYNQSILLSYGHEIKSRFAHLECSGMSVFVKVYSQVGTNKFLYLVAGIEIGLNEKNCTLRRIASMNETTFTGYWLINGELVKMRGRTSFFENIGKADLSIISDLLMFDYNVFMSTRILDQFFLCPYIEVGLAWYNTLLTIKGGHGPGDVTNLTSLSMETNTLSGVYVLSEDLLAVCADQYLNITNTADHASPSYYMVVFYFAYMYFQWCVWNIFAW